MNIALVGIGGALGAIARYLLGEAMLSFVGPGFPYGTWLINLSGSLLLGVLSGLAVAKSDSPVELVLFATVGFLGAYTTFSTVTIESLNLMRQGTYGLAFINSVGQILVGIAAAGLGFYLGSKV